jgi:maleamate amidohydrolase
MNDDLLSAVEAEFDKLRTVYTDRGFGGRVGFGSRPAVLVVDFIRAFTDPASDLGGELDAEVAAARQIVDAAREAGAPIVFSTVEYDAALQEAGVWLRKIPSSKWLIEDTPWVEVDERMGMRAGDMLLAKKYASCFAGTDLVSRLVSQGVDTLIIAGCTTSGCVRASAVDACSLGFRTIVVREAVGDRAVLPHVANLFDIDMKYGDVISVDETLDHLAGVAATAAGVVG